MPNSVVKTTRLPICRPDSKSQVTLEYNDNNKPERIKTIVISTQHDDFGPEAEMLKKIDKDIKLILIPRIVMPNTLIIRIFLTVLLNTISTQQEFLLLEDLMETQDLLDVKHL